MKLEMRGQTVTLLPQRALYLDNLNILAIADVRIGDRESDDLNDQDLDRISRIVTRMQPEALYVIGDFIHDIKSMTPDLAERVQNWRKELDCALVLIEGNHDRKVQPYIQEWNMVVAQSMTIDNFVFSHQPSKPDKPRQIVVSGHVHPTIRWRNGSEQMQLPCFVWEEPQLILPSFGTFSGGADVRQRSDGRYFTIADHEVIEITSASDRTRPADHLLIN